MQDLILELLGKYPNLMSAFVVIGVLRAIFKPIMVVMDEYVKATPSPDDDSKWAKFKEGKIYAGLAFFFDYAASIKLPK